MTRFSPGFINSGGVFTPLSIPELARWYDAGLSSYTGGTWEDLSSAGIDVSQATAGLQPTANPTGVNGKPSLTFDGGDYLFNTTPLMRAATALTTIVITQANAQNATRICSEGQAVNTNPIWATAQTTGTTPFQKGSVFLRRDDFATVAFTESPFDVCNGSPHMWGTKIDQIAQTVTHFADGSDDTPDSFSNPVGTTTVTQFSIGCLLRATASSFFVGDLAAVLVLTKSLSSGEMSAVQSYYQARGVLP
jgi:hypothetical protein